MAIPPPRAPARKACHLRPLFRTQISWATACAESLVLTFGVMVIAPFSSPTIPFPFPELFVKSCAIHSGGVTASSSAHTALPSSPASPPSNLASLNVRGSRDDEKSAGREARGKALMRNLYMATKVPSIAAKRNESGPKSACSMREVCAFRDVRVIRKRRRKRFTPERIANARPPAPVQDAVSVRAAKMGRRGRAGSRLLKVPWSFYCRNPHHYGRFEDEDGHHIE